MFPRGTSLVLVLEYMCSGLWEMLHHKQLELTLPRVKTYAMMMLKGTRYMHAHYVMHRVSVVVINNIKPESTSTMKFIVFSHNF